MKQLFDTDGVLINAMPFHAESFKLIYRNSDEDYDCNENFKYLNDDRISPSSK